MQHPTLFIVFKICRGKWFMLSLFPFQSPHISLSLTHTRWPQQCSYFSFHNKLSYVFPFFIAFFRPFFRIRRSVAEYVEGWKFSVCCFFHHLELASLLWSAVVWDYGGKKLRKAHSTTPSWEPKHTKTIATVSHSLRWNLYMWKVESVEIVEIINANGCWRWPTLLCCSAPVVRREIIIE